MNIKDLIDQAKNFSSLSLGQMAEDLEINQARISEWKKGKYRPGPTEIVYLAEKAGLQPFEVLAELESEIHPTMASVWQRAVSQLRQNKGLSRLVRRIKRSIRRKSRAAKRLFFRPGEGRVSSDCRRPWDGLVAQTEK